MLLAVVCCIAIFLGAWGLLLAYLVKSLGRSTCIAAFNLLRKGCIRWERLTWQPLGAVGVKVVQPEYLGSVQVFAADRLAFSKCVWDIARGQRFEIVLDQPWLNFTTDRSGLLHLVALLQDVGYLHEARCINRPTGLKHLPHVVKLTGSASSNSLASTHAAFSGEAWVLTAQLIFANGSLEMPPDLGKIIGSKVRSTLLLGAGNIRAHAQQQGEADCRWAQEKPDAGQQMLYPLKVSLESENLRSELRGWRTETGVQLHEPLSSRVEFTPELAMFAFSRLHPLLGRAVDLKSADYVQSSIIPLSMHLPAEQVTLRLEPMKLLLKAKGIVTGLLKLLRIGDPSKERSSCLECWTSAVEADVYRDGLIVSKRMDILLGNAQHGNGIYLVMWGRIDTALSNTIDMVLGVPAVALRRVGGEGLPNDYVFQIPVSGTAQHPAIDWITAGKDLAEVLLKHQLKQGIPLLRPMLDRRDDRSGKGPAWAPKVPPPTPPLPWDAFDEAEVSFSAKMVEKMRSVEAKI